MDVIAFKINIQKKLEDYEQFVDDEGTEESKWIENGDTETAVDEGAFDDGHYDEGDDVYMSWLIPRMVLFCFRFGHTQGCFSHEGHTEKQ